MSGTRAAKGFAQDVRVDLISDRLVGALGPMPVDHRGPFAVMAHPSHQGSRCAGVLVLLGQAGEDIGFTLALFGGQVRHSRRVLLPAGMAAGLRIGEDSGIDEDWRTGQHGEIERVTGTGIDLDDPGRALDNHHRVEDVFDQSSDSHLGQPYPGGSEQVRGELAGHRPGHLGSVEAARQGNSLG